MDSSVEFISDKGSGPVIITSKFTGRKLESWVTENYEKLAQLKHRYGAILFRGFGVEKPQDFSNLIGLTSSEAIPYMEQTSPRDQVKGHVYTSTAHRSDQQIFVHNEQSFKNAFPLNIYFCCVTPSTTGGQTPLVDTRKILKEIPDPILDKFHRHGYVFKRNFIENVYVSWQKSFQTDDRSEVERYCRQNDIHFEWDLDFIELVTHQKRNCIARHPHTGELCWFNHCTFFNKSCLPSQTQDIFEQLFDGEYPNDTLYGDGSPIESEVIDMLKDAYEKHKVKFDWQQGDMLMVDNMLMAHGRESYEGERLILTGMSEVHRWENVTVNSL